MYVCMNVRVLRLAPFLLGGLGSLLHHAAADLAHVLLQRGHLGTHTIPQIRRQAHESVMQMLVYLTMHGSAYVCTVYIH